MDNVENFLEHFGVKGMKWGKRKVEGSSTGSSSGNFTKSTPSSGGTGSDESSSKPATTKPKGQAKRDTDTMQAIIDGHNLKNNPAALQAHAVAKKKAQSAKVMDHTGPDGKKVVTEDNPKASGMSKKQKVLLGVGAGVAVAGLAYYGNKYAKNQADINSLLGSWDDPVGGGSKLKGAKKTQAESDHRAQIDALFPGRSAQSNANTYDGFFAGMANGRAKDRPEFTISKDTIFQRLSDHQETGKDYGKGTYATFLHNDNKNYGGSYEFGNKSYTLGFRPKEDVKVPSYKTVLETVKDFGLESSAKRRYTDDEAESLYTTIAGGDWSSPTNAKLIDGLKKKGYSAIVDDMDAGFLGDLPVVFFGQTDAVSAVPRTSKSRSEDAAETVDLDRRYG